MKDTEKENRGSTMMRECPRCKKHRLRMGDNICDSCVING